MTQEGLDVGEEERDGSREEPGSPMRANERGRQVPLKNTSAPSIIKANSFHCKAYLCP